MVGYDSNHKEKREISEIGIKYGFFFFLVTILQIGMAKAASFRKELISEEGQLILAYVILILSTYVIGYPVLNLLLKTPKEQKENNKLGTSGFIKGLFCMFGIMLMGVVIGQVLNKSIYFFMNISSESSDATQRILDINPIYSAITVGILGPVFEELIFRKKLIDCTIKYGKGVAILSSGIIFGLFHASVPQFFQTTGVGMLYAYVYIKTGRIRYSIIYHMINNLTVSVLMVEIVKRLDALESGNMSIEMIISIALIIIICGLCFIGALYVIKNVKRFGGIMKTHDFKGAFRILITSPGMWVYFGLCLFMIIIGYIE